MEKERKEGEEKRRGREDKNDLLSSTTHRAAECAAVLQLLTGCG